jgi:hypothetical protein
MELLPAPPGATLEEVSERWPAEGPSRPGKRTLAGDIGTAAMRGTVQRTGGGKKLDPFRLTYSMVSLPQFISSTDYDILPRERSRGTRSTRDPVINGSDQALPARVPASIRPIAKNATPFSRLRGRVADPSNHPPAPLDPADRIIPLR